MGESEPEDIAARLRLSPSILSTFPLLQKKNSLFSRLNATGTAMGAKMLRSELISPPSDPKTISKRHEFVEVHRAHPQLFRLQKLLGSFPDTDRMLQLLQSLSKGLILLPNLSGLSCSSEFPSGPCRLAEHQKHIAAVKQTFQLVSGVKALCCLKEDLTLKMDQLTVIQEIIKEPEWERISAELEKLVNLRCCFHGLRPEDSIVQLVAFGVDDCLDLARSIYTRNASARQELLLNYSSARGVAIYNDPFYDQSLLVTKGDTSQFIPLRNTKRGLICTTPSLQSLNHQIKEAFEQIVELTGRHCRWFLSSGNTVDFIIFSVCKLGPVIAELDLLTALAVYSKKTRGVRPVYGEVISLSNCIHPLLFSPAPTSYYSSSKLSFTLITGKNMSGKSTYAKGLVYSQIISQLGCFIRADSALLVVMKSISYVRDLNDVHSMLNERELPSLVVVDELECPLIEQVALAEWLIKKKVITYYITHRNILVKLLKHHSNVNAVKIENHIAESGVNKHVNALELMKSHFPEDTLNAITEYLSMLKRTDADFDNSLVQAAVLIEEGDSELKEKLKLELAK